jgi:hypothetical protein
MDIVAEDTKQTRANRRAVRRHQAESYLLISLIAFGVTVVAVRMFLQLTGFPQIGNSVLHIAHALWGALLLFIAVLLPLIFANRWAIQASALLSGVGIGLFIDEVGKFITQRNDYFFPPALPLIYGFFLLTVFVYLYFRRPREVDGRKALYHALEGFRDVLDGDLDPVEARQLKAKLAVASGAEEREIRSLALTLSAYLESEHVRLVEWRPSLGHRILTRVDALGRRIGRSWHHRLISILLIIWALSAILSTFLLLTVVVGLVSLQAEVTSGTLSSSELSLVLNPLWLRVLLLLELAITVLALFATVIWLRGNEERGQKVATFSLIFSLVAAQPLIFYVQQMAAFSGTVLHFIYLLILLAYARSYLQGE